MARVGVTSRLIDVLGGGGVWEPLDPNSHGELRRGVGSETMGELGGTVGVNKGDVVPFKQADRCVACDWLGKMPDDTHEFLSWRAGVCVAAADGVTGAELNLFGVFCAAETTQGSMMDIRSSVCATASLSTSSNFRDIPALASEKSSSKPRN